MLIRQGFYSQGFTYSLHAACASGEMAVVTILLERGASITISNAAELIYTASKMSRVNIVQMLIAKDVDVNPTCGRFGKTPLIAAAELGSKKIVDLLIKSGSKIQAEDTFGNTALHYAAEQGHKEVARLLIDVQSDLEKQSKNGQTPLIMSSRNGHQELVTLLVQKGASWQKQDHAGRTALHAAAENGHLSIVKLLTDLGSDQMLHDTWGRTPIMCASGHIEAYSTQADHPEVVKYLVSRRQHQCNSHRQDLYVASWLGQIDLVEKLLTEGADPGASGPLGCPLYVATFQCRTEVVLRLLKRKVNVDCRSTRYFKTPLISASEQKYERIVEALIDAGADVTKQDAFGETALHYAAQNGHMKVAERLIKAEHCWTCSTTQN